MFWSRNFPNFLRTTLFKPISIKNKTPNFKSYSKKVEEDDKPIKYSLSPASKWRAHQSRTGIVHERLWYEPYVLMASVSALLIYFCVLREENDIDLELQKSLYARIEGLEEHQLRVLLDYNKRHGLDTEDIIKRLNELESMKKISYG